MISVQLKINGEIIYVVQAYRTTGFTTKNRTYTYAVEGTGGKKIKHKYSDGAVKLAIKMLEVLDNL